MEGRVDIHTNLFIFVGGVCLSVPFLGYCAHWRNFGAFCAGCCGCAWDSCHALISRKWMRNNPLTSFPFLSDVLTILFSLCDSIVGTFWWWRHKEAQKKMHIFWFFFFEIQDLACAYVLVFPFMYPYMFTYVTPSIRNGCEGCVVFLFCTSPWAAVDFDLVRSIQL